MKLSKIKTYLDSHTLEIVCFLMYIFVVVFTSMRHEFWYDELQAYQISKDSIFNILFQVPHWEGHPPLWHLILKFFMSLGFGLESTLRIPNLVFIISAIFLLMFKSPFPKVVRLLLPFTFFLVYQYAVICRPYSLFILEMFLLAYLYKTKNNHPIRYASILALTCLTHGYGLFITTVISIVWGLEIKANEKWLPFLKTFVKDKRFHCMVFLFVVCLLVLLEIRMPTDARLFETFGSADFLHRAFYCLILLPSDATIFNILNYNTMQTISNSFFNNIYIVIAAFWGVFINIILYFIFRKTSVSKLFNIMYFGFLLFLLGTFLLPHHIGLLFIIVIFCFWCAYDDSPNLLVIKKWQKYVIALIFAVQFYWGIYDINCDIYKDYNEAKSIAKYIQLNHLNQYKISTEFSIDDIYVNGDIVTMNYSKIPSQDMPKYHIEYYIGTHHLLLEMMINSYINYNIFYNYNILHPEKQYIINPTPTYNEMKKSVEEWRNQGEPDIYITPKIILYTGVTVKKIDELNSLENVFPPEVIWGDKAKQSNYVLVKDFYQYMCFKDKERLTPYTLCMKKDLYEKIKDRLKNK